MKKLIIALAFLSAPLFAACGNCQVKIVDVHEVEDVKCPDQEVMVGMPESTVVQCGKIKCACVCTPEKE